MASSMTNAKKLEEWQTWPRNPNVVAEKDQTFPMVRVGFMRIALAVFVGNLLAAFLIAVIYAIVRS
jgi:hypothetical protein